MLTVEQRIEKVAELSTQYNCKVEDWTFENPKVGQVLCFAKEPTIHLIYAAYDKFDLSPTSAGELLMEGVVIKEASDPRIFETKVRANHSINLRVNINCQNLITIAVDDVKKK